MKYTSYGRNKGGYFKLGKYMLDFMPRPCGEDANGKIISYGRLTQGWLLGLYKVVIGFWKVA